MITAIPMKADKMSGHFTKSDSFLFFDDKGAVVGQSQNPALNSDCSGKDALVDLLTASGCRQVIVRNIGERMLSKLLERDIVIYQKQGEGIAMEDLLSPEALGYKRLETPEQGVKSPNYYKKQAEGGCGHNHASEDGGEHTQSHSCCGGKAGADKANCDDKAGADKSGCGGKKHRCCH